MASAANTALTSNLTGGIQNSGPGQKDVPNKPAMRPTGSTKMTERGRKDSPVDAASRRPPQKAWTPGSNPTGQRGSTPTQTNGSATSARTTVPLKPMAQKEIGLSDKHGHDRLRYILAAAVGLAVIVTTKAGDKFEGIFAGSVTTGNGTKVTLKMTKNMLSNMVQINGVAAREAALAGTSPEHAMTFEFKDLADFAIPEFSLPETSRHVNGSHTPFQTDADISGNTARGQRTLQKWEPDALDSGDYSLESGPSGHWDQFATHSQMFGDKSTYDENLYTTEIDRSAPGYKQREAEAARIAREIEGALSTNAHVREERGQTSEQDHEDEETKYSGVRRNEQPVPMLPTLPTNGPNKYTPPARRAPTTTPTVAEGAPFDSAIISAQLAKPEGTKTVPPKIPSERTTPMIEPISATDEPKDVENSQTLAESSTLPRTINTSMSPQPRSNVDNPTEDVENKVLDQFRIFANAERARIAERKRAQATQDRTAKLNDLLRFSKTFKLKTPIPSDMIGILAKDPMKQEAIVERAHKDAVAATSTSTSATSPTTAPTSASSAKPPSVPRFDASQVPPPIPDRATFNKGRGAYPSGTVRSERAPQQNTQFAARGAAGPTQRGGTQQDKKNQMSVPISLPEGRTPPIGPLAEQSNVTSPQRSDAQTPTSAVSTKMNARAMEFRPTAPSFNPPAPSNAPSSPASVQRGDSVSRAESPSSFFGARKPKPAAERTSVGLNFNPIMRMRQEIEAKKANDKVEEPVKDYPFNGGIPNAYHTGPVWQVKEENKDRTYLSAFERPGPSSSPAQSRTTSSHHAQHTGQPFNALLTTPQHNTHAPHHVGHQYDEHRMHLPGGSFASPGMTSRHMSNFTSPMSTPVSLVYNGTPYYGLPNGQMPLPMRQYPGTPGMMHAQPGQLAPMMVQPSSTGPYMAVPQGYGQMQMYTPNPTHVFPQQNGYPSPGRVAPMMMQQGSQQSHHGGQQMMYAMSNQGAPMTYGQQGQIGMMRGGYGGLQGPYGTSPHQPHHMQQRAMSTGYGQKGMLHAMQQNQGPPANAPQQPAAYSHMEMGSEDAK